MIKFKYLSNAEAILTEIRESVTAEEKRSLKKFLIDKTPENMKNLEKTFRGEVFEYIRLNPKQRLKDKKYKSEIPYYKSLVAYISYNYMQRCAYLLKHLRELPEENGIREILASVAIFTNDAFFKEYEDSFFS